MRDIRSSCIHFSTFSLIDENMPGALSCMNVCTLACGVRERRGEFRIRTQSTRRDHGHGQTEATLSLAEGAGMIDPPSHLAAIPHLGERALAVAALPRKVPNSRDEGRALQQLNFAMLCRVEVRWGGKANVLLLRLIANEMKLRN